MATGKYDGGWEDKHPEEDSEDIAALLDRAADRFSACMDAKVDSMMDLLEKRIDEKIDSKLGPVMDRLSVLEKTGKCEKWSLGVVRISRQKHTWPNRACTNSTGAEDLHALVVLKKSHPRVSSRIANNHTSGANRSCGAT